MKLTRPVIIIALLAGAAATLVPWLTRAGAPVRLPFATQASASVDADGVARTTFSTGVDGTKVGLTNYDSFDQWDINSDGVITAEEARATRSALFTLYDSNADGVLTSEDMAIYHAGRAAIVNANRRPPELGGDPGAPSRPIAAWTPEREAQFVAQWGEDGAVREAFVNAFTIPADLNGDGDVTRAEMDEWGRRARSGDLARQRP